MLKGKLQFAPPKLTMFFGLNTKVLIFAIYPTKLQKKKKFQFDQYYLKIPILPLFFIFYFLFFILFFINKKTTLGVEKWPNSHPKFFL
jgi:hypothetical protein